MERSTIKVITGVTILLPMFVTAAILYLDNISLGAMLFIVTSLGVCLFLISRVKNPVLRYSLLFALILRTCLAMIQAYTSFDLPGAGKDAVDFEIKAWEYVEVWRSQGSITVDISVYYYSAMIAVFYLLFGRSEIIPLLINVYLSLATIYLIFKLTVKITSSSRAGGIAAVILVFLPTHSFFAAVLLRETIIIFLLTFSFYFLALWIEEGKPLQMLISFLALAVNGVMHGHLFLLVWINLVLLLIYIPQEKRFKISSRQLLYIFLLIAFSVFLVGNLINYQLVFSGYPLTVIFDVDFIREALEGKYINVSRTLYLTETFPYSYFDILWQTPIRITYFLLAPFPWALHNFADIFFLFDVLIYAFLIVLFGFGVKRMLAKKLYVVTIVTLSLVISLLFLHAWGTVTYGTAWRHRQKLAPFLVPFASLAIASSGVGKRLNYLGNEFDIDT
jgi:4-amino-4-deoxy-L-arabinose transferase-like glycosyltransferase